jgi:hypothetical protein
VLFSRKEFGFLGVPDRNLAGEIGRAVPRQSKPALIPVVAVQVRGGTYPPSQRKRRSSKERNSHPNEVA